MIKCKVFSSCLERGNGDIHWGPEKAFNKFCKENPNIDVIKIDTLSNNGDSQIFLYYKEPETTYSHCSGNFDEILESRDFKAGDIAWYRTSDIETIVEIISISNNQANIAYMNKGSRCYAIVHFSSLSPVFKHTEVKNFKIGDIVTYRCNCKEYKAVILRTTHGKCIIKYNDNIVETNYLYIDKVDN